MSDKEQAIVRTKSGQVEGSYEDGLYIFKGIPFAEPPVGPWRWLPPQPVKPWDGVRPARKYGRAAPQNPLPINPPGADTDVGIQNESCLFLNVWTPGLDDARRPVMFWIHGGAFIIGSGMEPSSHGGNLAVHGDVVVVSINYRLGALGFMNLKEITGGRIPATGNEGLLDQVAALEWVHDNIKAFGGDPDNITVFGFSSGGMSIGCLLGMPAARGKFGKSLHQSGAANVVDPLDKAVKMSGEYLKVLGLNAREVEPLRALTSRKLLAGQLQLGMKLRETERVLTPFQPVVDGEVIPEWPIDAIKKGSARNVITLAGTALEEYKANSAGEPGIRDVDEAGLLVRLEHFLGREGAQGLIKAYREARRKRGVATGPFEILSAITTDLMFRMPTIQLVEAQRDNGQPAYNFIFTYESPLDGGMWGACHGLDRRFIFGTYDHPVCGSGPAVERLSRRIQDAWLAFARTGDPSCESIGKWPVYGKNRMTMLLDRECRVVAAPYEDERRAWEAFDMRFTPPI